MPTPELGKLEEVNLRDIWSYNFTSWLADNLDLLGNALGLNLKLTGTRVSIGKSDALNILAEEAKGGKVAIEDRIGWTDYFHVGQLVRYAAGCDAEYVVWVARHFDAGHRACIDWLNRVVSDKVWFYGVEIRAVKIGDSLPAPDFRVVAAPEEWWLTIRDEMALPARYQEFFQPLVDDLRQRGFTEDTEWVKSDYARYFDSGVEDAVYAARLPLWSDVAEICCEFDGPTASAWVSALQERSKGFEGGLTEEWSWTQSEHVAAFEAQMEGHIFDSMETLDDVRAWMLENLTQLKKVLNPLLEKIQSEIEG